MIHFTKVAAQGELIITRLDDKKAQEHRYRGRLVKAEKNGTLIVGHSETGHHHVIDGDAATMTRIDELTAIVTVTKDTELRHLRETHTHESVALQPGMYEFRTGREFDPFERVIRASMD